MTFPDETILIYIFGITEVLFLLGIYLWGRYVAKPLVFRDYDISAPPLTPSVTVAQLTLNQFAWVQILRGQPFCVGSSSNALSMDEQLKTSGIDLSPHSLDS